jgi:hypothetical protein
LDVSHLLASSLIRAQLGRAKTFLERTYRDALGAIVIQSRLQPAPGRQGFERQFFPGVEVGLVWRLAAGA